MRVLRTALLSVLFLVGPASYSVPTISPTAPMIVTNSTKHPATVTTYTDVNGMPANQVSKVTIAAGQHMELPQAGHIHAMIQLGDSATCDASIATAGRQGTGHSNFNIVYDEATNQCAINGV